MMLLPCFLHFLFIHLFVWIFQDIHWGNELKQAAFKAFASLGANDEDIRKKVTSYVHT